MKLQPKVPIQPPNFTIAHHHKIMSIGSCFAQNMAQFLHERKFQLVSNPFGIIYNPLSISNSLGMLLDKKQFTQQDLFFYNERWHSFDHHSSFSHPQVETTLSNIQTQINQAHNHLMEADALIITLGTAFLYSTKKDNRSVANCHKIPNSQFDKRLLEVETIVNELITNINAIRTRNSKLKVVFTISPIRHIRDGFIENQQSKATLILAVKKLVEELENTYYFPSYEIVLDELRDYRFYNSDMVHLSDLALAYIWNKFENTFFKEQTLQLNQQFVKLRKAMTHRSFNAQSAQHKLFLTKYMKLAQEYQKEFKGLDFKEEIKYFSRFNF